MNYRPCKPSKWEVSEEYHYKTTQDILLNVVASSINDSKRVVKKYRYRKIDNNEPLPKDMLVILPSNNDKTDPNFLEKRSNSP